MREKLQVETVRALEDLVLRQMACSKEDVFEMKLTELISALNRMKVQTGSLDCKGCGYEHNCSTQAALKLIRAMEGATPVSYQDAIENLAEELGDVQNCVLVLEKSFGGLSALSEAIGEKKMKRWCERLEERHG
jgi:NTP pyrophosphatase (non-canonical NTP hydrolase)